MRNELPRYPAPPNEPTLSYAPGSPERASIVRALDEVSSRPAIDIPLYIGGRELRTGRLGEVRMPHRRHHLLATYHQGGAAETMSAIVRGLIVRTSVMPAVSVVVRSMRPESVLKHVPTAGGVGAAEVPP